MTLRASEEEEEAASAPWRDLSLLPLCLRRRRRRRAEQHQQTLPLPPLLLPSSTSATFPLWDAAATPQAAGTLPRPLRRGAGTRPKGRRRLAPRCSRLLPVTATLLLLLLKLLPLLLLLPLLSLRRARA